MFCVKRNMRTLAKLRNQVVFKAKNGGDGSGWNKYGKDGEDVVIAVPPGTTIRDAETDELIQWSAYYEVVVCTVCELTAPVVQ